MKIKVLYEQNISKNGRRHYTTIEIPDGDYSVTLDIDYEQRLAAAKPEKRAEIKRCNTLQEMYDILNDEEYKRWRRYQRHVGNYNGQGFENDCKGNDTGDDCGGGIWVEPLMDEIRDDSVFNKYNAAAEYDRQYDECCEWIRKVCSKKPHWANAFIAVRMDGMSVNDYAASIGAKDASIVSKWLARAAKKLEKHLPERQI